MYVSEIIWFERRWRKRFYASSIWNRSSFPWVLSSKLFSLTFLFVVSYTIGLFGMSGKLFFSSHCLRTRRECGLIDMFVISFFLMMMIIAIIICTFRPDDMMSAHREQTITMKKISMQAIHLCLRLYDLLFEASSLIK